MPALTSTLAAVRQRLLDRIEDLLPDVQATYGWPPVDRQRSEFIAIGGTSTGEIEQVALKEGRRSRDETHETTVSVCVSSKPTPMACEARAVELAGVVEGICADDPKLGGVPGLLWITAVRSEMDAGYSAEGRPAAVVELVLSHRSRLR